MYSSMASISLAFSLNQTTRARRPSIETISPMLNLGMSGCPSLHPTSAVCAGHLNLCFLDEDGLVSHAFAVENSDRFLNPAVVLQLYISKRGRHARDEVTDNADRSRLNPPRLHPLLQLTVGTVVGDINEKQFRHLLASCAGAGARVL